MTQTELARKLNVTPQTIINWRETKPLLYQLVIAYKDGKTRHESDLILQIVEELEQLEEIEQKRILLELKLKNLDKISK